MFTAVQETNKHALTFPCYPANCEPKRRNVTNLTVLKRGIIVPDSSVIRRLEIGQLSRERQLQMAASGWGRICRLLGG
jgi:hypothetical protein